MKTENKILAVFDATNLKTITSLGFGLIVFYGISTITGNLMPNPLYHIYPTLPLGQVMTQGQFF